MKWLYFLGIKIYGATIYCASFFNPKARLWINGRKNIFLRLSEALEGKKEKRIWFHCSSLGEFEQGKPVMEAIRQEYSGYKIILTFYSPSGYEIRKNDAVVDYVFYLPTDGKHSACKFIKIVNPKIVFFVKNDFWYYYIKELKEQKIPLYVLSARFRPSQVYFLPPVLGGKFFQKMLRRVAHFFVQDQQSLELLYKHSIPQVTVSGDTRFDRVFHNSLQVASFPEIEKFCNSKKIFIAGSTWPADEKIIIELINQQTDEFKFIIAPHEINQHQIDNLVQNISKKTLRYSELTNENADQVQVLVIDSVGILASLYRYAHVAYVGGAFGKGLHNILEAVVFGLPVFFGKNYHLFPEAVELVKNKTAFSISFQGELQSKLDELFSDPQAFERIKKANKNYIEKNKGATSIVMNYLKMNFN
ncbi:MAG: 3-deoxy-D-manno-octulosonic acid transferase [Bacteroidia bacterium]